MRDEPPSPSPPHKHTFRIFFHNQFSTVKIEIYRLTIVIFSKSHPKLSVDHPQRELHFVDGQGMSFQ